MRNYYSNYIDDGVPLQHGDELLLLLHMENNLNREHKFNLETKKKSEEFNFLNTYQLNLLLKLPFDDD